MSRSDDEMRGEDTDVSLSSELSDDGAVDAVHPSSSKGAMPSRMDAEAEAEQGRMGASKTREQGSKKAVARRPATRSTSSSTRTNTHRTTGATRVTSQPSTTRKKRARRSDGIFQIQAAVLITCGLKKKSSSSTGAIKLVPIEEVAPSPGTIPKLRNEGRASFTPPPIEISSVWSSHELLTLLRQLLPHFFQYIDTLEPREDGEHHWDLCEKIRDKLIVCEADEISGNTAYLVRGRLGVNGLDRCLWIATRDPVPQVVVDSWSRKRQGKAKMPVVDDPIISGHESKAPVVPVPRFSGPKGKKRVPIQAPSVQSNPESEPELDTIGLPPRKHSRNKVVDDSDDSDIQLLDHVPGPSRPRQNPPKRQRRIPTRALTQSFDDLALNITDAGANTLTPPAGADNTPILPIDNPALLPIERDHDGYRMPADDEDRERELQRQALQDYTDKPIVDYPYRADRSFKYKFTL